MAVHAKHLDTAEVAYAAIQEADKVYYIQYIKELPLKEARAAEMSVMTGNYQDAENMLLQSGLVFRAILLNIYLHQWEKALDLAIKNKTHVDTVLAYRLKYLARCDKEENNAKYVQYCERYAIWTVLAPLPLLLTLNCTAQSGLGCVLFAGALVGAASAPAGACARSSAPKLRRR